MSSPFGEEQQNLFWVVADVQVGRQQAWDIMGHPFLSALQLTPTSPTCFAVDLNEDWLQGKGTFGGLVSAIFVRAGQRVVGPERILRALTVSFCAPARPGRVTVDVEKIREGARITTLRALMRDDAEQVVAAATLTCAVARALDPALLAAATFSPTTMPDVPAPATLDPMPTDTPFVPGFTKNFDFRFAWGDAPGSSGAPKVGAWLSFREPGVDIVDEAFVVAMLDAVPPALLSALPQMVPAASVEWTVQFLQPLPRPLRADECVLVTSVTRSARDGYADEMDELWTEDGLLLAQARQTYTLI